MNPWIAIFLFIMAAVSDITWTRWTQMVTAGRAVAASLWAMSIVVSSFLYVDAYLHSRWYVIPLALGAGVGTWLTVWWAKRGKPLGGSSTRPSTE